MNARITIAAALLAGILTGGCGQQSSAPHESRASLPPEFRASLIQFLDVIGELNASTEAGVSRRDFGAGYARAKSKADLLFAQWPKSFQPQAKQDLQKAMEGYELAAEFWNMGSHDTSLYGRLEDYGVEVSPNDQMTSMALGDNGNYWASKVIPKVFAIAGNHYDQAKSALLEAIASESK